MERSSPGSPAPRLSPMKVGIIGLGYVGLPLAVAFAEAGDEVVGVDVDPRVVDALAAGQSRVEDVADDRLAAVGDRLQATSRYDGLGACDAVVDLRPDAARQPARARPQLRRRRRPGARPRPARGPARRARVDHLPGHDPRAAAADPRGVGPRGRPRLPPRLLARSGSTRAAPTTRSAPPRSSSAGSPRPARERAVELYRRDLRRGGRRLDARRRPSSRSCSRTSSARSTSRSSTSSRCSATGWASTSGRWSTPPRPSPSGSCASSPGPGWAATACRSTPSTSPSRRASTTSRPSSSSSPARSTRPSRTSASTGSRAR